MVKNLKFWHFNYKWLKRARKGGIRYHKIINDNFIDITKYRKMVKKEPEKEEIDIRK